MSDIALTVSVLALVAVVGLWIGNIKVRGVGFGIGGVLFGGIIVGHFVDQAGVTLSGDMLHFIQEFGLILFVYTIGIQVGPGFFASLRVSGLRLNLFAVLIVIMGGLVTAILHKIFAIPLPVVLGIFSGAVTNTPALGAGQQILRDLGTPVDLVDQMGMSYAMAYPFGICGILLTMWLMRLIFRVNVEAEAQKHESSLANGHSLIQTMNIRVENPNLNNMAIQDVPILNSDKIICSRLKRDDTLMVPSPGTIIQAGDLLHLVGQSTDLHNAQLVIGKEVDTSLSTRGTDYRFSLANERTFLAWIRTSLGFLAAGVGLDQLAPDFATPVIRELLALLLCLFAGGLAIYGYLRWLRNEKAMRLKEDLPYTHSLLIISVILMIVAVIVMGLVLYAG